MKYELYQEINKLYTESELFQDFNGYILIKEGHEVLFEQNYGYSDYATKAVANEHTIYNLGSITKQFTAMCILQLVQNELLSLDDCLGIYLTDFKNGASIKVRDMLNMASGMPEYWCKPQWQETENITTDHAYEFIKTLTDYKTPLKQFEYSNSNYIVLGKLIEKISDLSLGEYMERNIFNPLGMERTTFLRVKEAVNNLSTGYKSPRVSKWEQARMIYSFAGAGGIYSTAADLCKWDSSLYTTQLLNKKLLEEMFKPILSGYGMGWYINGDKASHGGDAPGYSTRIMRLENRKLLMVILSNFDGCKESNMGHYADMIEKLII